MDKKNILIQFRTDGSLYGERECYKKKNIDVQFKSIFENDNWQLPQDIIKDNNVILGGSGEFYFSKNKDNKKEEFKLILKRCNFLISFLLKNDIPTLGICFGHQILGYFLGVEIINDPYQKEVGTSKIKLTKEGEQSNLYKDLPEKFYAQCGHQDSLAFLPENSILLAESDNCKISSFKFGKNIYGVQFHPEFSVEDVKQRLELYPSYKNKKEIFCLRDSPFAEKILYNFIKQNVNY